jgi:hypothetical protein
MPIEMAPTETFDRERTPTGRTEWHGSLEVFLGQRAEDGDETVGVSTGEKDDFVTADAGNLGSLDGIARVVRSRASGNRDPIPNRVDPISGPFVPPRDVMGGHSDPPPFGATNRSPFFVRAALDEGDELGVGVGDLLGHGDRQ